MDLSTLTIKSFRDGLRAKEFRAFEVAQECFKNTKARNDELGAYLSLNEEEALRQAEEVDIALAKGEEVPPLAGVPLAVKDVILIKGKPTTGGSKILENYTASYDATVIEKLKKQKVLFTGKTNLDEFAMGGSSENSGFYPVRNPWDPTRVPGGSSGGSAVAVAAGMAIAALGTDTGGSIRQPAGFCGVVGLKPTYGAVSRHGLMPMAASLNQIGPLAKTAEDTALLFDAIRGRDPYDANATDESADVAEIRPEHLRKLTIGLPKEYFVGDGLDETVEAQTLEAIDRLKAMGFSFKEVSLPHTKYALACYYIVMPAEVSADTARYDGIRYSRLSAADPRGPHADERGNSLRESASSQRRSALEEVYFKQRGRGFGPEVKRRIILGTFVLSSGYYDAYYAKAQKVRALIREDFVQAFKEVDVILAPVSPVLPFKIGERVDDPLSMYLADIFTVSINLAGLPGLSLPVRNLSERRYSPQNLPVGFQLIGRPFRETDILGIGRLYEKISG
jgi:aspartyl-tRNA(Asn)/glutamyl-tRNA(Gln) amidotransferase subunit A